MVGKTITDVWTDWGKIIKRPKDFKRFKEEVLGRKIENIKRRAKNIIFELSGDKLMLIHQKMTGHLLYGSWQKKGDRWLAAPGPMSDPMNRFLHLIFMLNNGKMLALSDLRKFAKVELWDKGEFERSSEILQLGPEPLEKKFTFSEFKKAIAGQKRKIKQVLMDQSVIAGIGNIYSDEILFYAKVHPFKPANKLREEELKAIYSAIKEILLKAIKLGGESISDYRKPSGEKGEFDKIRKVYRREGEKCQRCGAIIKRLKMGGRSAHFCPRCQI